MKPILLPYMDPAKVACEIGNFIVARVKLAGATGCVIGLSGGVDSTTVAALTKRAFDAHNEFDGGNLELVGYLLPSKTNERADTDDGFKVAARLKIRHEIQFLEPLLTAFRTTNFEAYANKFDKGNLTSRIRAVVLNTKGATEKKIVAGTGNRDEDYGIGYYTLFGDGAVHISPIGCLSKRLVREMARFLGFEDLADRVPTAGLEPGQTDFKDLCYKYDIVELVSEGLDQGFCDTELAEHEQVCPVICEQLMEYLNLYGEPRLKSPIEVVRDIIERKKRALAKSSLISPAIPKVTLEYR